MTDLLQAASDALGTPADLVQRSAAARAAANGTSVDDILSEWSGGAPAPKAQPEPEVEPEAAESSDQAEPEVETSPQPEPAAVAVLEPSLPAPPPEPVTPEPEVALEPVAMGTRLKTSVRIGAWTGAALGVIGFLAASVFWAPNSTVLPESGPVVTVSPSSVILGIALVSVVFGAIVASMSRAATAWTNPAMQLSGSRTATAWIGALVGLILGVVAGAMLNSFGTAVEDADPAMVQLPVLATLFVMVIGGAVLGAMTALVPQFLGVPVAVDELDQDEVETLKNRLGGAMSIPIAGLVLMAVLVLPFAYALIQSNHLAPGVGGAVVAILAAGGVLGFASLAGSKPEMRISLGDVVWALLGIGAVLVIVISVMLYTGGTEDHSEEPAETAAAVSVL